MKNVMFGLTKNSSNEEIKSLVFAKAHEARYFSMATIPSNGELPGTRFLDFMTCKDDQLIYFGVGAGKVCGEDIAANPVIALNGAFVGEDVGYAEHRSLIAFRISGYVRKANNPRAIREYWLRNPGSKKMWENGMDVFKIYCLYKGEGELYQVYKNDKIYRLRFGFGGMEPRPYHYQIASELCSGCGICQKVCTARIIELIDGKASIPHHHCYECGRCFQACPTGAVKKV